MLLVNGPRIAIPHSGTGDGLPENPDHQDGAVASSGETFFPRKFTFITRRVAFAVGKSRVDPVSLFDLRGWRHKRKHESEYPINRR